MTAREAARSEPTAWVIEFRPDGQARHWKPSAAAKTTAISEDPTGPLAERLCAWKAFKMQCNPRAVYRLRNLVSGVSSCCRERMRLTSRQRRRAREATQRRVQEEHENGHRHREGRCPVHKRCFGPLVWYGCNDTGWYWRDSADGIMVYYSPWPRA